MKLLRLLLLVVPWIHMSPTPVQAAWAVGWSGDYSEPKTNSQGEPQFWQSTCVSSLFGARQVTVVFSQAVEGQCLKADIPIRPWKAL